MSTIVKITTHDVDALARLLEQFKDKVKLTALLGSQTDQIQQIEDAMFDLYTERTIETAVGTQLDVLGKIVGRSRTGDDDFYRLTLRAQILANRSDATTETLYRIVGVLTPGATLENTPYYPAGFVMTVTGIAVDADLATLIADFIRISRGAGIEAHLIYSPVAPEDTFTFSIAGGVSGTVSIGATSITLIDPAVLSSFPSSGDLILDPFGTFPELISYAFKTGTGFGGVTGVTANHTVTPLIVVWNDTPGLGFDDGYFAGVIEA